MDTDWDPQYNDVAAYPHAFNFAPVLERFANFIYVGDYEALRRVYRVDVQIYPSGANTDYRYPADEIVAAYPGFVTTALHRHEGKLYYALADPTGAVNGYVYSWDGFENRLEYSLPVPGGQGVAMCSFRNTLVVTVRGMNFILAMKRAYFCPHCRGLLNPGPRSSSSSSAGATAGCCCSAPSSATTRPCSPSRSPSSRAP